MEILRFPEDAVPRELRDQVVALQDQAWPPDDATTGSDPIHDPALRPLSMLLVDGGRVISALDILSKELTHAGARLQASGLSTMVTDRAERGKGLGSILAAAAKDEMGAGGADLGIFTCDAPLRRFYERAGFAVLPGTVLVGGTPDDPFPSDRFDKVTLAAFFTDLARRAASSFEHARIELYPGSIDKLW